MVLTVGSLFAGIGGIDLGLERAGMESRWFVEWDAHCQNILRRHWPGRPVYGDITAVDWSTVEPVDVLAGGFPCQPVSNAGKRLGTDDDRWLWPEFARAIRILRPRYVLVENVAALLGRGFEHVITDLAALGYDAEWDCIPAAAVGAPHLRDRLWTVAYSSSDGRARSRTGNTRRDDSAESQKRIRSESAGDSTGDGAMADTKRSGPQPLRIAGDVPSTARAAERAAQQRQRSGHAAGDSGETVAHADAIGRHGRAGEQRTSGRRQPANRRKPVAHPASLGWREGRTEPAWQQGRPDPAERGIPHSIFSGLEGHERGVMALTDYRRSNADPAGSGWWATEPDVGRVADGIPHRVDRLRSLGNAVVPQVVEWIGRRIVAFDESRDVAA